MSTTCLPSTSPRVLNVGPGPSDTNGTVTTDSSTPNATIGTSATTSVRIRLFTPPTVERHSPGRVAGGGFTLSVTRERHATPPR